MNYYNEIKEKLIKSEIYDKAKDYAKDRNKVKVYFEIGELLSQAGKEYGKNIIRQYSEKLMNEVGKKYNERNLRYMRQFYEVIRDSNWNTLCSNLCWSHYREILTIKSIDEIIFYLSEADSKNLTQRQLHEIIRLNTYNRISLETKNKLINSNSLNLKDLIPNPIILKSNININDLSEYALKQTILNNLDKLLNDAGKHYGENIIGEYSKKLTSELGKGYSLTNLKRMRQFYLLIKKGVALPHQLTWSHVLSLLPINDINKTNYYIEICKEYNLSYRDLRIKIKNKEDERLDNNTKDKLINKEEKKITQDKTIGIIICKEDNKFIMEYCSDDRIFSRTYELCKE